MAADAAAVYRVWQAYLASKSGKWSTAAGTASAEWIASEQKRWPTYDLAAYYLADGAAHEILSVERVDACGAAKYRITTRFRAGEQGVASRVWSSSVLETAYAERVAGRWVLENALLVNTCEWQRVTIGAVTYVFATAYPYNPTRARRAAAFTDSLASALQLPRLDSLTYYLTANVDEMYRILGLESDLRFGATAVAGLAQPINRQLFSGSVTIGEDYRHELAHLVLAPLCCERTSYFISEGVATWLGGTTGADFPTVARALGAFLAEHPTVVLDSMLVGSFANAQFYAAGAVLTDLVFARGGTAAVKRLFEAGATPAELRATLERELKQPWPGIADAWRRRALELAK